jgi:hypothetical protein
MEWIKTRYDQALKGSFSESQQVRDFRTIQIIPGYISVTKRKKSPYFHGIIPARSC